MSLNHELLDEAWKQAFDIRRSLTTMSDDELVKFREDMLDSVNAVLKILNRFTNYEDVETDSRPAQLVLKEQTGKGDDKIVL